MAETGLKKSSISLWGAIAAATGIVVASNTLVSLGQGFGVGGGGFLYAMILGLILNLFIAFTFCELATLIPRAGGINHYTLPALGPFFGIFAMIAGYLIVSIFSGGAETAIPGIVISEVFLPNVPAKLISTVLIIIIMLLNIRGAEFYSWSQILCTAAMILSLVILGVVGLGGAAVSAPLPSTGGPFNPMGLAVFSLTGLGFWLFVGTDLVCPLAEEIDRPQRNIPLAMITALAIILIAKTLFGFAAIKYVPLDTLAGSPMPHVVTAEAILGKAGAQWMGIIGILASVSTLNTLIAGIPRMLYGMALEGQMPACLGWLHPRYRTPWLSIIITTAVFLTPVLVGISTAAQIVTYILAGCFIWLVTYIIAHLDVIILRLKYPHAPRPFRSPLWILPQILGILGMIYMMLNIFPDPVMRGQIYRIALWFLILTAAWSAFWVKVVMKRGLLSTVPLEKLTQELTEADKKEGLVEAESIRV